MIVTNTGDGFTADVPSLKGCDSWAHSEDDAIDKTLDLVMFYLNLKVKKEIKVDRARRDGNKTVYKLVFKK